MKIKNELLKASGLILFFAAWELAPAVGIINPLLVPPPTKIAVKLYEILLTGELLKDIAISLQRVSVGFVLAVMVALPLGFLLGGWFKTVETAANPLLQVLAQANPFTLLPVFIALLGIGEVSKIAIIFWVSQWPILFNTIAGIRGIDPLLVKVARSTGLGKWRMFWKVLVPAATPSIFTGIRMSAGFSFFMLIGAEMVGSHSGLGFLIIQAQATAQWTKMFAGIVAVAMLGILIMKILITAEHRVTRWKEEVVV